MRHNTDLKNAHIMKIHRTVSKIHERDGMGKGNGIASGSGVVYHSHMGIVLFITKIGLSGGRHGNLGNCSYCIVEGTAAKLVLWKRLVGR